MKIIGESQHYTLIVEMSVDEWESVSSGTGVMPFIGEQEFLHWAKDFKAEFNTLEVNPYVRQKINGIIDFLSMARDRPDHPDWQMVLTDGNHLRSLSNGRTS